MNTFLYILFINICVYSIFRRSHKLNIHKYLKMEIEIHRDRYIFSGFSWWAAQIENQFSFETFLLAILNFQKEFLRLSEIYLQLCLLQLSKEQTVEVRTPHGRFQNFLLLVCDAYIIVLVHLTEVRNQGLKEKPSLGPTLHLYEPESSTSLNFVL